MATSEVIPLNGSANPRRSASSDILRKRARVSSAVYAKPSLAKSEAPITRVKNSRRPIKSNRVEIEFDPGIEAPVKSISLRLPREMLNQLKVLANKKDIPYQSLIKVYLAEKIAEERKAS
jgi:predicted DNA binding CopG/RHH family protein